MRSPEIPKDEDRRLHTLRSLSLLDTPGEERFDRLTRLARRLFQVPVALVSLVDRDRQWFKSRAGLEATETPRDISFCGHAILRDEVFVIPDVTQDERFHDNPLVTGDPKIRFYAGCPVRAPDGQAMGTLCIIDQETRQFSDADREALRDLAEMVDSEIAALSLATRDTLTGLSNRRGFEMLADHALRVAQRNRVPVAVLYFDLDGFKEINDSYGHAAGDQALAEFSELLLHAFRESDVVARMGGDEFCVLLSGIAESEIYVPLERFAQAIADRNASPVQEFELRYSVGLSTDPMTEPRALTELIERADRQMYARKQKVR